MSRTAEAIERAASGAAGSPRQRILAAADRLFRDRGVAATNVEDIATEAGMSRATLYRHIVGGRDEIVLTVVASNVEAYIESVVARVSGETPEFAERMVRLFRRLDAAIRADESDSAMFHRPSMGAMVSVEGWTEAAIDVAARSLAPIVAEARDRGELFDELSDRLVAEWFMRQFASLELMRSDVVDDPDGLRPLHPVARRRAAPRSPGRRAMNHDEVEAVVRREIARYGRRWVPVGLALLLVLVVLATTQNTADRTGTETAASPVATDGSGAAVSADPAGGEAGSAAAAGAGTSASASPSTSFAPTSVDGTPAAPDADPADPAAPSTTPEGPSSGTSRSGVVCDGTNRQLPFSDYGPRCVPEFSGDNGGATSFGVTADTVTVTFRIADSASVAALQAAAGDALNSLGADQEEVAADMAVLVDFFNSQFELYGRQVDFKTYSGQGDVLEEYQNRGAQGAQADAARAKDLGAFADVSIIGQTQLYAEAIVSNQIVAMSPVYLSRRWHEERAPFSHSALFPTGEAAAGFQSQIVCQTMKGQNATRSNDPTMAAKPRVFGIVHPENPEYAVAGERLETALKGCGARFGRRIAYALDATTAGQQATNGIAQLRAAGVTTVLCVCDHTFPIFFTQAADQQNYVPEWFSTLSWPDPFPRLYSQRQWDGALYAGGARPAFLELEPGRVYAMASGGEQPHAPLTLDWTYQQILLLFTGLQAAGPELNPATMYRGLEQVPSTVEGDFGPWEFGPGPAIVHTHFQLGRWDQHATSNLDGKDGAVVSCRGGRWFRFDAASAIGNGGRLDCP